MTFELTGKIIQILPELSGTGKNGQWSKQDFILETQEQYPRKVCFSAWGEKVALVKPLKAYDVAKVSFNVESREFNGRWYTDLRMWKIEQQSQTGNQPVVDNNDNIGLEPLLTHESENMSDNDLPF